MKEKIQKMLDDINSDYRKLQLQIQNINTFAEMNGYEIDWEYLKIKEE